MRDAAANSTRILTIDTSTKPAVVNGEIIIFDRNDVFLNALMTSGINDSYVNELVNADKTINLDAEGVARSSRGGFWIAHEGRGEVGNPDRPIESLNMLVKVDQAAVVEKVVFLPDEANALQDRRGFEGVTEDGDMVFVVTQRSWQDEEYPRVWLYNTTSEVWTYRFYPVDAPESFDGGWVGLADTTHIGGGEFLVLERDSKKNNEAAVKRIYKTKIDNYGTSRNGTVLTKEFVIDVLPLFAQADDGKVVENIEGMGIDGFGNLWVINDDGGGDHPTIMLNVIQGYLSD